jgi:hypothetical protein
MKKPIDILLDQVAWELLPPEGKQQGLFATHRGVLELGEIKIPCYRLNDGRAAIEDGAIDKLFPDWKALMKEMGHEVPPPIKFTP